MSRVKTGLDILLTRKMRMLRGARVGLLCHQASVDSSLRHVMQLLHIHQVKLTALFAPEHGLWGMAQDQVSIGGQMDPEHGVPIYSLYGEQRSPNPESLEDIDILICDLQDVGSRYYTFVWTMALALEACAKSHKKMIILDRPNPLGGKTLEGPVLDTNFSSFVGLYPVPVRHGMTIGELAQWVKDRLEKHPSPPPSPTRGEGVRVINVNLEVVPMEGWRRNMYFTDTGLPWVLPSPNMPTPDTALVYPGACLIEGTNLSEGRGTTRPFELLGAPYINPESLSVLLNGDQLPSVKFRACRFEPTFHKFEKQSCGGIQIHITDKSRFKSFFTGITILKRIFDLYPRDFAWRPPPYEYETKKLPIDILCGTDKIRKAIEEGRPLKQLEQSWQADLDKFNKERKPFLLYN